MKIELVCEVCGVNFLRHKSEVERNRLAGRRAFCSRKCSGTACITNFGDKVNRGVGHLNPGNKGDEYSPFRVFMCRIRARMRDKGRECSVTVEDLKEQWERQNGKCPYTGWMLQTPKNTGEPRRLTPYTASLDRVNSSKGYVKGNVEFISLMAQWAKNSFSKEDVVNFCEAVYLQNCLA